MIVDEADVTISPGNRLGFGFVPLPKAIRNNIVSLVTQKTDDFLNYLTETGGEGKVDLEFTDIRTEEDQVTVTVIIRPTT